MVEPPADGERINKKLKKLPVDPGVYKFFNADGELLYVGKAKSLRARVRNYFQPNAVHGPRTRKLVEKIADLEWTIARSEVEALVLEANLIRELKPPFNVLLRDDKSFLYVKITAEPFPAVFLTRRLERDKATYFGPYAKAGQVRKTLDFLREVLRFRNCEVEISPDGKAGRNPEGRKIPCLDYQIHRCDGPCDARISLEEYRQSIQQLTDFLRGKTAPVRRLMQEEMLKAAAAKEFEKAARFRDLIRSVETIDALQAVSTPIDVSADVIGMSYGKEKSFFHVLFVRHGKVLRSENFNLPSDEDEAETLFAFLREHIAIAPDMPAQLVVPGLFPAGEQSLWEDFIWQMTGQHVALVLPQRGPKRELLALAEKNAKLQAVNARASFEKNEPLDALQSALSLDHRPERIECYDISHLGGTHPVASQVVFVNGKPDKSSYRKYHITSLPPGQIDDFAAMAEVMRRRLRQLKRQESVLSMTDVIAPEERASFASALGLADHAVEVLARIWRFVEVATGRHAGYAALLMHGKLAEIRHVWVTPEFEASDTITEIIKTIVLASAEKCLRIVVPRKDLRFQLHLKALGLSEDKKPPKPFLAEASEKDSAAAPEPKLVFKITPADLKRAADQMPDLIVIDGGKGQLSAAHAVLTAEGFDGKIALCSLAKREEEIFLPHRQMPLPIAKGAPENMLLQRLRDEAHRFAISFNKRLRAKAEITSVLDEIPGIGEKTRQKLLKKFGSAEAVLKADAEELKAFVPAAVIAQIKAREPR